MRIFRSIEQWQKFRKEQPQSLGFVPTMGSLHQGHLSLIKRSLAENQSSLVSIFLNPTQFDNPDDLKTYPVSLEEDIKLLEQLKLDFLLLPDFQQLYPDNYLYKVQEEQLSRCFCGRFRKGHFDGVLTVVLKLLNIARADKAYFGEKDYQQYKLIKGMAEAFFLDTEIVPCPLLREADGLALSSRNKKLSEAARKKAPRFYQILTSGKSLSQMREALEKEGFKPEYLEQYDDRLLAAVYLDNVRLIDNVKV